MKASVYGVVIGLLLVILYVFIFIPYVIPALNSMFIDWINGNANMFTQNYCTIHYVFNQTTNTFSNYTDCHVMDLRPTFLFIWQFTLYFAIPVVLILITIKIR